MPMRWWECRIQVAASGTDPACSSLLPTIAHCEITLVLAWKVTALKNCHGIIIIIIIIIIIKNYKYVIQLHYLFF